MVSLKRMIRRGMLALALITVIIMLALTVAIQISIEEKNAYENAMKTFTQIEKVLEVNGAELEEIKEEYRQQCLNNAQVIAQVIEGEPDIIYDVDALRELARITEVDEIHLFDTRGHIFAGTHTEYYDFTFDSGEQIAFFKPMLADHSLQLVQDITPNTAEGKLMQYSAVWSRGEDFIVQVGMEPVNITKMTEKNELSYLFPLFRVNPEASFYAVNAESGEIVGSTTPENVGRPVEELGLSFDKIKSEEKGYFATVNGVKSYCVFQRVNENYLGRVVNETELFSRIPVTVLQLAACLAGIVILMSYAITIFMNRFVVEKIQTINQTLHSIAVGNLEETIDVRSSLEFSELSDYLNGVLRSLLDNNRKMSYVLSRTNMYIGVYDYNRQIRRLHYTEYLPQLLGLEEGDMKALAGDFELFHGYMEAVQQEPVPEEPGVFRMAGEPDRYLRVEEIDEGEEILGVVIDVTADILRWRKIELERDVDPLTGLYNRRGMDSQLSQLFREPEKLGHSAFVMVDADGLKQVNDTFGHQKGDAYLKTVAELVGSFGSKGCVAARQGGDEFVLFLYDYDSEEALMAVLDTFGMIQDNHIACLEGTACIPIRFSYGWCLTRPGASYSDMIKEADKQMYRNKRKRKEDQGLDGDDRM